MDNPQLLWPSVASVPVLVGFLWWFAPRLWRWWNQNRPPNRLVTSPTDGHTPVFDGAHPYLAQRRGSDAGEGSPSPPSSPLVPIPISGVGSFTPSHPRRLSLRSATLNPSR